jgi:hypothetical protein
MAWNLHQMNLKIVLLNRVIEEEAYAEKPKCFEVYLQEILWYLWEV